MKLALIGTFYKRYPESQECIKRVLESSRIPDDIWIMVEDEEDADNILKITDKVEVFIIPTPRDENGKYAIIPYSYKINWALDRLKADAYCYLDNGSLPHKDKYKLMEETLESNPDYRAVYCTQHRTGFQDFIHEAIDPIPEPYAKVNYTQVMHRPTKMRWPEHLQWADPNDLADAVFWESLNCTFYPVHSNEILDVHNMESSKAAGL